MSGFGTVTSNDGTTISYLAGGSGPPLLLIHGGGSVGYFSWNATRPALEEQRSVVAMHRRGHGRSALGKGPYSVAVEADDIVAVIRSLDKPVHVLGHSLGGILALEAALHTDAIATLVLYEPMSATFEGYAPGFLDNLDALLLAGDREGIVVSFFRNALFMPDEFIDFMRSAPTWQERVAAADGVPRELRTDAADKFVPGRFSDIHIPTTIIEGEQTTDGFRRGVEAVASAVPGVRKVTLPGQGHVAMVTAPGLLAAEVIKIINA
jgi:pimeloyl-ACP methyl ester carboxylesterase